MHTVFSHIIQKRFSQVNEDVSTDALAFILYSSESARKSMMKMIRFVIPDMPDLYFRTQQTEGSIRPDMWGWDNTSPRLYIENKFWAGLTDNQPVNYLKQLAEYIQPTMLLLIAPAKRQETLWRELLLRLNATGISIAEHDSESKIVKTDLGPMLAIRSWENVLSVLEHDTDSDQRTKSDVIQLRALCYAADNDAFYPVSAEQLSEQRTPAFILQLSSIVQSTVDLAVTEKILNITGLKPQANWERIGRYARIAGEAGAGVWLGINFVLWKNNGRTPLWLFFSQTDFGRAREVRCLIEPWAAKEGAYIIVDEEGISVALDIPVGEEKTSVVRFLVDKLKRIAKVLDSLPPKISTTIIEE